MYRIFTDTTEEMVQICADLVKRGVNFESKFLDGRWVIECTGGY